MIKSSMFIVRFFLAGLMLSQLVISPYILDFSLLPRFICLSFFIGCTIFFISKTEVVHCIELDIIILAYLMYCLFCGLSIFWAINTAEALFEISKTTLSFFFFLLTYFALKINKEYVLNLIAKFSILIFLVLLSVAIFQYLRIGNYTSESRYLITGLNGHKNLFASFLFLNLFFLLIAFYELKSATKIAAGVAIVITILLLLLLKTKAVWLGGFAFIIVFVINSVFRIKQPRGFEGFYLKLIWGLIILNVFFVCVCPPAIELALSKLNGKNDPTLLDEERLVIWNKSYDLFYKHPVTGVGAGNWQVNFPDATLTGLWRAEDLNFTFQRPHNDFLWILSETGLIGLNVYFVFIFCLFYYLVKALRSNSLIQSIKIELRLSLAIIIGYLVISFFDFPKERIEHSIIINVIFAIVYYHIKSAGSVISFGSLKTTKLLLNTSIVILAFIFVIGLLRYRGEYYTRKVYDYKSSNQSAFLIQSGISAKSFAYSLDPTSIPISWYIANAELATPENSRYLLEDLKTAYRQNPYNRNVLNDLASAYALSNNIEMAKQYYEEAARISPRFDEPKLNLAAIYINEKNYEMADAWNRSVLHNSERRSQYQRIIDAFR